MVYMNKNLNNLIADLQEKNIISTDIYFDNLFDLLSFLSYDQYLIAAKNKHFIDLLKSIRVYDEQPIIEVDSMMLPNIYCELDNIVFNNEFDKLILKVRNSVNKDKKTTMNTLYDIINIKDEDFLLLSGIGDKYFKLWKNLKEKYIKSNSTYSDILSNTIYIENEVNLDFDLDEIIVIIRGFDKEERKYIKKFEEIKPNFSLKDILYFSFQEFSKISGVGQKFFEIINQVKDKIKAELNDVTNGKKNLYNFECMLISPKTIDSISLDKLADILVKDIEFFLDSQSEDMQDIFQKRWGFIESKVTLEELGETHGVTRERIRQKEKKCNNELLKSLSIRSENIWLLIQDSIDFNLIKNMNKISDCFDSEKAFLEFLSFICGDKDISKLIRPEIPLDLLGDFFAKNGMPSNYDEVKDYIYEYSLINNMKIDIDNAISVLKENNRIIVDGEKITPKNLKKEEASACILAKHKNGLPWIDIAKLVNMANISRTNLYLDRPDNAALTNPDAICLAGKGIYKHIRFMNLDAIDIDRVFDELLVVFIDSEKTVIHLGDICRDSDYLKTIDYYAIRYLTKYIGEQYGFYFDGKSQTDSVSIESNFKNVTQKDVIIQALKRNKKPMTKVEIASLLKSKSISHAAFYLDQMMKNQQVVQVDRMLYTLPELAYENIDIELFLKKIQFVLEVEGKPVDPSIFEVKLNQLLNQTYSRYFYASIAKKYTQERGWFRSLNLYSMTEIPFKNLMDAISQICLPNLTIDENYQRLQQHIAITREKASITIGQWIRG